jgi:hypothetical protein
VSVVSLAALVNDPSVFGMASPARWVNGLLTFVVLVLLATPWVSFAAAGAFGEKTDYESNGFSGVHDSSSANERIPSYENDLRDPLLGDGVDGAPDDVDDVPASDSLEETRVRSTVVSNESSESTEPPPLRGQKRHALTLYESLQCLVNNLSVVSAAVGSNSGVSSALVSVFSVCNCLGRLVGGEVAEFVFAKYGITRVQCLAVAQCAVALGVSFAAACPTPLGVFVAVSVVGAALGAHWVRIAFPKSQDCLTIQY